MKPYESLTVRGKARRLRPLAMSALNEYDIDVDRIELVRNDLNGIFRVRAGDGASYMLRVCLPEHHEFETLRSELIWLEALAAEPDIPAPRPIPARNGDLIVTASDPGVPEPRHCMVFSWLPGRDLHRVASPENFEEMGRLMARLHRQSKSWRPPEPFQVRTLDSLYLFGDPEGLLGARHRDHFGPETRILIGKMEQAITSELEWLHRSGRPQVVHGDLHWGNVKVYRGRLLPLDFEDLCLAFPVQDIAISLYYAAHTDNFPDLREAFRRGYEDISSWPEMYPNQIELHIVHRAIDLYNYVLGSPLRHNQRLMDSLIASLQGHQRQAFETWQAAFQDAYRIQGSTQERVRLNTRDPSN